MSKDQLKEWAGKFGDDYHDRSPGDMISNKEFFQEALGEHLNNIRSVTEFGCGTGANLEAFAELLPNAKLTGIEINQKAAFTAQSLVPKARILQADLLNIDAFDIGSADLVFTKGVLIHIPPQRQAQIAQTLFSTARRYILIAEYFSPEFREIEYRGKKNMLWSGPHAYQLLDMYWSLQFIGRGFASKRDALPQDDLTWFLLEKR